MCFSQIRIFLKRGQVFPMFSFSKRIQSIGKKANHTSLLKNSRLEALNLGRLQRVWLDLPKILGCNRTFYMWHYIVHMVVSHTPSVTLRHIMQLHRGLNQRFFHKK